MDISNRVLDKQVAIKIKQWKAYALMVLQGGFILARDMTTKK